MPRGLAAPYSIPPRLATALIRPSDHGACTLTKDAIADLSSVSYPVVKTALRTAKAEGLIKIEQGRRYNTITVSAKWKAWLDRYGDAPPDGSSR